MLVVKLIATPLAYEIAQLVLSARLIKALKLKLSSVNGWSQTGKAPPAAAEEEGHILMPAALPSVVLGDRAISLPVTGRSLTSGSGRYVKLYIGQRVFSLAVAAR